MPTMEEIDKALLNTEKRQRIKFIIFKLNSMRIYKSTDGRKLGTLEYKELEQFYIDHMIKVAKAIKG